MIGGMDMEGGVNGVVGGWLLGEAEEVVPMTVVVLMTVLMTVVVPVVFVVVVIHVASHPSRGPVARLGSYM